MPSAGVAAPWYVSSITRRERLAFALLFSSLATISGCDYTPECRQVQPADGPRPGPVRIEVAEIHADGCTPSSYWEYAYDDRERLRRSQKFSAWTDQASDWVDYYYDDDRNRLLMEVERSPSSNSVRRRREYFYADNGLLQHTIEFKANYNSTHRRNYTYDAADRRTRMVRIAQPSGEVMETVTWSYDEFDRIAEKLVDMDIGLPNDGIPNVRCTYSYHDRLIRVACDGGSYELDGFADEQSEIHFDEYGNRLEKIRKNYIWIRGYGDTRWVYQYR